MTIMITGGAGYIGSHTCVELIRSGYSTVIFDNFSNSQPNVVDRIKQITGVSPTVVRGDIRDSDALAKTLSAYQCSAVLHFAGLKSVLGSIQHPLLYYDNNVLGSLRLVEAMQNANVRTLVFSSSAAVYGEPISLPLREDHQLSPASPYGRTKLIVENMLDDLARASNSFNIAVLRYFNPAGAHESGLMGESPPGKPNNLITCLCQVAIGRLPHLKVFGKDYDTPDGTGVRDYVHIMDLATGHLRALESLAKQRVIKVNLGTGHGSSVLEIIHAFSKACGKKIPYIFAPRRHGDVANCYACANMAYLNMGWRATRHLNDMCADAWRWQISNPSGYSSIVN